MDRITAAEVFIDVTRSGSFTATANRLSMSRPMVTRYVEALEHWFGVRLLHRTTRKVTLTTLGEQCLLDLELWLDAGQLLIANVKPSDVLTGSIKIATSVSFAHTQLMAAISEFMILHPKISIEIDLQDTTSDLVKSRIDLAIRIASNPDASLIGKPIALCRSVIVAHESYLARMPAIKKPEDLCHQHCLGYTNFENQVWHLTRGTTHKSISVNGRLSANEATALLEATLCGTGLSLQPTYMANKMIQQGDLVQVLPEWKPNDMNIYALYSSRKFLAPTVRAFIDFIDEYFKNHTWDI
ncbi:LysR family transcriptional regulator [Alteromonas stellipolaris]|jgi:DNA-binding transcriptional LysR family regulator|uniref:LysR family transcriptional regulator n=1 Tax=Alteromonas stellipolaris TaxID=233316 RepID=UPI0027371C9C|nr:LysR family transcriptional regulator [Alteromonas stellipolaris]MDP2537010.1 LysR family transcriptional regulator [Alteromonas stellipolaris]